MLCICWWYWFCEIFYYLILFVYFDKLCKDYFICLFNFEYVMIYEGYGCNMFWLVEL